MTVTQTPWNGATFFKVLCRLGVNRADSSTDPDTNPDLMTIGGTVDFVASVPRFRYIEADGRGRMVTQTALSYNINPLTGELTAGDGSPVYLLDTGSSGVDPSGFTYSATINPAVGASWPVTFSGHQPSGQIDLVSAATIAPSVGVTGLDVRMASVAETGFTALFHFSPVGYFQRSLLACLPA